MKNKTLSDYVFASKYAKYDKTLRRRETYEECVDRYLSTFTTAPQGTTHTMGGTQQATQHSMPPSIVAEVREALISRKISGSQRGLQFGGEAILRKNERAYNCSSSFCDRPAFFKEAMYLLLCGCGVGFSVSKEHVNKLPRLCKPLNEFNYVVEDSIEGWADAADALLSSFFNGTALPRFDYSLVRPAGSPISHGGKAPGADGLADALLRVRTLLFKLTDYGATQLRPIDCFDIVMHLSNAVLSGGIRRSACLTAFDLDDEAMLLSKTGDWFTENPQRARANISAIILPHHTQREFNAVFSSTKQFGEPGFLFLASNKYITNPCVSGDTLVLTTEGYRRIDSLVGKKTELVLDPRFGKGKTGFTTDKGAFATGVKQLYRLDTNEGYTVELTAEHQVMTARGWVEAQHLVAGDKIHTVNNSGFFGSDYTFEQGLMLGWFLGDGTLANAKTGRLYFYGAGDKESCLPELEAAVGKKANFEEATNRYNLEFKLKELPDYRLTEWTTDTKRDFTENIASGSRDFWRGFLSSLFSADGTVAVNAEKGSSIRLTQTHMGLLEQVQRVLLQFGIFSKIYKNRHAAGKRSMPDGKGGVADYECLATHELVISRDSIERFRDNIKLIDANKQLRVELICNSRVRKPYRDNFVATFTSLTPTRIDTVYDLTQPDTSSFIANGLVVHNCAEILMCPLLIRDASGKVVQQYTLDMLENQEAYKLKGYSFASGWSMCNLSTINCAAITPGQLIRYARLATILGTYQAALTKFPYLGADTEEIVRREALLGVSLTGVYSNPGFLNNEVLRLAADACVRTNKYHAEELGISPASRITCVKPEGTASLTLGVVSAGLHPYHAEKYIRRVQANKDEPLYKYVEKHCPTACEPSVWGNADLRVISFACSAPSSAITRKHLSVLTHIEDIVRVNRHWVRQGTANPRCEALHHNVSCTLSVQDEEWEDVKRELWLNREYLTGVSMLSSAGDYIYQQAPLQEIFEHSQEEKHRAAREKWEALSRLPELSFNDVEELEDLSDIIGESACAGGACLIPMWSASEEQSVAEQPGVDSASDSGVDSTVELSAEAYAALHLLREIAQPLLRESPAIYDEVSALLSKYIK